MVAVAAGVLQPTWLISFQNIYVCVCINTSNLHRPRKTKDTLHQSLMAKLAFFLIFISIPLITSHKLGCTKQPPQAAATATATAALFIFGDSFFDPGNNNYINTTTLDQANFSPYGESYFRRPTGRFSDGRLISDFIGKRAPPSFMQA